MHSGERRGAHGGAHTPGRMANWDLVRIFLEVARTGSFRAASGQLNMSANFLSKRISLLERAYKTTLMTRHVDGIRLTREGLLVLEAAKRMEEASFGLDCTLNQATPSLSGEVRIAVTEGLGTFWLAPRLVEFQRAYPGLLVDREVRRHRLVADLCARARRSLDTARYRRSIPTRYLAYLSSGREENRPRQATDRLDRAILRRAQISVVQRRVRAPEGSAEGIQGSRAVGEPVCRLQESVAPEDRPDLSQPRQRDRLMTGNA